MKLTDKLVLLIDNSNTRTKFIFSENGLLREPVIIIPTAELSPQRIAQAICVDSVASVVISSVVPSCAAVFSAAFSCPVHFVSAASPMSMVFDYPGLATLGADRIANALAVAGQYAEPCIVVDAGTATTFDIVVQQGETPAYIGGVIAPGLAAFTSYLHRQTALLPLVSLSNQCTPIAKNTVAAIQSGCIIGFGSMVKGIIDAIRTELGTEAKIVLTGGDGQSLVKKGFVDGVYSEYLTFIGLLHVANRLG